MNQSKSLSLVTPRTGRWLAVAAVVTSMAVLGGCANPSASSGVYSYDQAQREQIVRTGTVTGVRPIVIQKDKSSGVGMLAGCALGGVARTAVGGGTRRTISTVGGAILGALAGNAVENRVGKNSGYELTVRLDNGETKNYSEDTRRDELAVIETTNSEFDQVTAIPESILRHNHIIRHPSLPFQIVVRTFFQNSRL